MLAQTVQTVVDQCLRTLTRAVHAKQRGITALAKRSVAAGYGLIPVTILSLLIRVLELFVSFLQAYIFTFLTTLFIASAVAPEH